MKTLSVVLCSLLVASCASAPRLNLDSNLQAERVAIIGHVSDEVNSLYQGVTVFENTFATHAVDWNLTAVVAQHVAAELDRSGFSLVDDLTSESGFGFAAKDVLLSTWSGGRLNPALAPQLDELARRGYGMAIVMRDTPTFVTVERSIPGKGVLFRRVLPQSSLYASLAVTAVSLRGRPALAGGSWKACPDRLWKNEFNFRPFPTRLGETKGITRAEIEAMRSPFEDLLRRSADAELCYYGLVRGQ